MTSRRALASLLFAFAAVVPCGSAWSSTTAPTTRESPFVQPDRLAIGTVYTGATVQASFAVMVPGGDASAVPRISAPAWVRVLGQSTSQRAYGTRGPFARADVSLELDTATPKGLAGEVRVDFSGATLRVPVSATIRPPRPGLTRLLVASTPWQADSTGDGHLFDAWTRVVDAGSINASYVLTESPVLKRVSRADYDCVLVGDSSVCDPAQDTLDAVRAFANAGGRVVVAADAFFVPSVSGANEFLADSGIAIENVEDEVGDDRDTARGAGLDPAIASAGVVVVEFFRASPVKLTPVAPGLPGGKVLVRGSLHRHKWAGYIGLGRLGRGEVYAIGQSLWWSWIGDEAAKGRPSGDNGKVLQWIITHR